MAAERGARRAATTARRSARRRLGLAASLLFLLGCGAAAPANPSASPAALRRVQAPTVPFESTALAELPGVRADRIELAVAFPEPFDPARSYPILIPQVTSDSPRSNIDALSAYAGPALASGYVVLTAQGIPWPTHQQSDTIAHRYASLRAALRWLAGELPASERWPIVLAGFSGGAKISQALAFSLTLEGRRVAGVFLGGCNEDHTRLLLGQFPAVKDRFTQIAFFLSVGEDDRIAPPDAVREVARHLRGSGVRQLELSVHRGGHRLDARELSKALGWLRARIPGVATGGDAGPPDG